MCKSSNLTTGSSLQLQIDWLSLHKVRSHGCHTQLCNRNIKRTGFKVGIELSPAQSCLLAGSSSPQACGLHNCLLPLPGHFHHRRGEQRSRPGLGSLSPVPFPGMVLEPVSAQAGSQLKCQCHIWSVSRLCSLPTGHMDSDRMVPGQVAFAGMPWMC